MLKRTITGILLAAAVLAVIGAQGYVLIAVLSAAMLMGMHETLECLRRSGEQPVAWAVYLLALLTCAAQAFVEWRNGGMLASLAASEVVLGVSAMLAFTAAVLRGRVDMGTVRATLFPMLYPGAFFCLIFPLNTIDGKMLTVTALMLTFFVSSMDDLFALIVGLKFGKHRLSPEISPKKSVEGAVAGLIAAVAFSMILPAGVRLVFQSVPALRALEQPLPPLWQFAVMGVFAGALGQIGDLAASMVKRSCGVKDFGSIFPGHGGLMDRIDGVLFSVVPILIFFLMFV